MAQSDEKDKVQIGLTPAGVAAMQQMMNTGFFAAEGDAYKLAVAYALANDMNVEQAPDGGYQTKFNAAGGIDRDGTLRDVVATLRPEHASQPYTTAEKLAELGIVALVQRLSSHEALADILYALQEPSDTNESAEVKVSAVEAPPNPG